MNMEEPKAALAWEKLLLTWVSMSIGVWLCELFWFHNYDEAATASWWIGLTCINVKFMLRTSSDAQRSGS